MPERKRKPRPLVRPGEPSQTTEQGLEIPIVKTEDFERLLRKAATTRKTVTRKKNS